MASQLYSTIDALCRGKGIDPQIVVSAVEDAIVVAVREHYGTQENLRAELDRESGKIHAFAVKTVVESPEQIQDPLLQVTLEDARKADAKAEIGGELRIPKVTDGILGRAAAQLAKQVIFQKVHEAERAQRLRGVDQRSGGPVVAEPGSRDAGSDKAVRKVGQTLSQERRDDKTTKALAAPPGSFEPLVAELNALVGLPGVKSDVAQLTNYIKIQQLRNSRA